MTMRENGEKRRGRRGGTKKEKEEERKDMINLLICSAPSLSS